MSTNHGAEHGRERELCRRVTEAPASNEQRGPILEVTK